MVASLFPPGSVIRRVDGEAVLLLGGGRALLMQLAHPAVAAGVRDHSDFRRDPLGRLQRTLEVTTTIVFGTEEQARQASEGLRRVHDRVTGPGYQANDPQLLMWVHATLVDTAMRVHRRFVGGLSERQQSQYYSESVVLGEVLGIPAAEQPADLAAFRAYVRDMVSTLEVSDDARRLARSVLRPRVPLVVEPLVELGRQLTAGLLPAPLRQQYELSWDQVRQAALITAQVTSRRVLPLVPGSVRRGLAA